MRQMISHTTKVFTDWLNFFQKFSGQITHFQGRTLPPEKVTGGKKGGRLCEYTYKSDNADWGALFRNYALFGSVTCPKFLVMFDQRDQAIVDEYLKILGKTCMDMGKTLKKR